MSRIEQHIVNAWASRLASDAVKDVIGKLRATEAVLSGDSGLAHVWEEICAQVQRQESAAWPAYTNLVDEFLYGYLECLDRDALLALWAATDAGWDYLYDHHADKNAVASVPLETADIVRKLAGEVMAAAAAYESPSLYRYIWGEDDPR